MFFVFEFEHLFWVKKAFWGGGILIFCLNFFAFDIDIVFLSSD